MKLQEVFEQLTYGELSQLHIGGAKYGAIDEGNYPALVSHINLGLTTLYKRFCLREGRYIIPLVPGTTDYTLSDAYLVSAGSGGVLTNDVFKIEKVTTDLGKELNLNISGDVYACSTPTMKSLRVPAAIVNRSLDIPEEYLASVLEVMCRVNHYKLVVPDSGIMEPTQIELELPYGYLNALLYFIASRVHNPIGMVNEFNAGNNYAAKFEAECQQLEGQNIQIDQDSGNSRLSSNGWV